MQLQNTTSEPENTSSYRRAQGSNSAGVVFRQVFNGFNTFCVQLFPVRTSIDMTLVPLPKGNEIINQEIIRITAGGSPANAAYARPTAQILLASARLAQSAERKALNLVVVGSSPTVGV